MKLSTKNTACIFKGYVHFLTVMIIFGFLAASAAMAIPVLNLRSTSNFVILAGSTITGIPPVNITGNVGLSPAAGSYIAGFDGSNVVGTLYVVDASGPAGSVINATLLQTAKSDLTIAYNDAAGRTPVPTGPYLNPGSGNMGGLNLSPGLYKFTSSAAITGANLTLTGNATDVWIFQISSSLNVGSGISIILAGGAQASNIFWQVGTSATIGTYADFEGTILADQSISFDTGSNLDGRALAFTGAVTMGAGVVISLPNMTTNPIFSVNPKQLNFGNIQNGLSKLDSVTVTNTGNANLIINSVTSSNLLFTVTPNISIIAPGASRKFYITFAPLTDGLKNGYIYFNHASNNLKDSISVNGTGVSAGITINPRRIDYGNVNNGLTKLDSITITNTGTANLIISSIISTNTHFAITETNALILPGTSQKFYILYTPLTSGFQDGYIRFVFNSTNLKDSIYVNGTGTGTAVIPVFSVNPNSLNFDNVNCGETKSLNVVITNTGTANLTILGISSNNVFYKINPIVGLIPIGGSKTIVVTFSPLKSGIQNGKIYFYHNAANSKDSITVTGTGTGSCTGPIFLSQSNIDFGTVFFGTSKQKSVFVTNGGSSDLIISNVESTENQYTITPIISTIAAGASQEFFITFTPTFVGQVNGDILFTNNAGQDLIHATGIGLKDLSVITIDDARKLPVGSEFIIEGIVTRTLGKFTRIQDGSAGLTIVQSSGQFFNEVGNYDIQIADRIRVQGRITEQNFLKVINENDLIGYQRLSRLNVLPTPVLVTLAELKNNGEIYESRLVTLTNLNITSLGDMSFKAAKTYQVTDASDFSNSVVIRIGNSTDTYMDGMPFIGTNVTFQGVLSQSGLSNPAMGYELTPILPTDLRLNPTGVEEIELTEQNTLFNNYPNPFSNFTTIQYDLASSDYVTLKVLNVIGQEMLTLVNGYQEAGTHTVIFPETGSELSLSNGIYLYILKVGTSVQIKQMIIIK